MLQVQIKAKKALKSVHDSYWTSRNQDHSRIGRYTGHDTQDGGCKISRDTRIIRDTSIDRDTKKFVIPKVHDTKKFTIPRNSAKPRSLAIPKSLWHQKSSRPQDSLRRLIASDTNTGCDIHLLEPICFTENSKQVKGLKTTVRDLLLRLSNPWTKALKRFP